MTRFDPDDPMLPEWPDQTGSPWGPIATVVMVVGWILLVAACTVEALTR